MRCGETQKQLGETERKFVQSTNIHFLTPLRSFTEGGYRAIQTSKRIPIHRSGLHMLSELEHTFTELQTHPLQVQF
ncbi:hypothetical protein OJAV_G00166910 [Oryzias javanicus]|uniref:Uncharacterized protein n=1 Tax=Oryzias javanicus TaxID=123683 RepID=A0A437CEV0_ORYJA|nr:hypothetical protein OJAV_G00166910 [Oryzias javanicus]